MRTLMARDMADAALAGLSADRRFATAYNAALQAANMAIAWAGYRIVSKVGHHRISIDSVKLVLGKPRRQIRRLSFYDQIEDWITKTHPSLKK